MADIGQAMPPQISDLVQMAASVSHVASPAAAAAVAFSLVATRDSPYAVSPSFPCNKSSALPFVLPSFPQCILSSLKFICLLAFVCFHRFAFSARAIALCFKLFSKTKVVTQLAKTFRRCLLGQHRATIRDRCSN